MELYTVDRANRTLPYVRRIVADIVAEHLRWEGELARLDVLVASPHGDAHADAVTSVERSLQRIAREIEGFERDLEALDIQLKDRRIGLIDFPSELDGRPVLLCWRHGEPAVQFWHDPDAGFAGRQPLSPTLVG